MTLRQKQSIFLFNIAKLIQWAFKQGWELTGGELYRTKEQQAIYVKQGLSQTMNSKHLTRLAIDLHLFIDGKYQQSAEPYKPLADYWISLHTDNIAGYYWTFKDAGHFQMGK